MVSSKDRYWNGSLDGDEWVCFTTSCSLRKYCRLFSENIDLKKSHSKVQEPITTHSWCTLKTATSVSRIDVKVCFETVVDSFDVFVSFYLLKICFEQKVQRSLENKSKENPVDKLDF